MINTKELREIANRATKEWIQGMANIPFYVDVQKPAPSMSKYDLERPTYWRYDDGIFACVFGPQKVLELLDEIDKLKEFEFKYNGLCK